MPRPLSAREQTLNLLLLHRKTGLYLKKLAAGNADFNALEPRDRGFAVELGLGTLAETLLLDHLLAQFCSQPLKKLENRVLEALRLGLFQILFMQTVPHAAAVNETVNLLRKPGARGFVNAVLRSILRDLDEPADDDAPPRRTLRLDGIARAFKRDVLPDPSDITHHLAVAYSHPHWLVARWLRRFGREQCEQILRSARAHSAVIIHHNPLAVTPAALRKAFTTAGIAFSETPGGALRLASPGPVEKLPLYDSGGFYVQDPAAREAVRLLDPQPRERILDLCAAPGAKAAQAALAARNQCLIDAVDISETRLERVYDNCKRLKLTAVRPVCADAAQLPDFLKRVQFDKALLDAPCSNTGVLRRRVEVRTRLAYEDVLRCAELQSRLLDAAADALKPGGMLVYSTCSLEWEENQDQISAFLKRHPFHLRTEQLTTPAAEHDGAYCALLQKA